MEWSIGTITKRSWIWLPHGSTMISFQRFEWETSFELGSSCFENYKSLCSRQFEDKNLLKNQYSFVKISCLKDLTQRPKTFRDVCLQSSTMREYLWFSIGASLIFHFQPTVRGWDDKKNIMRWQEQSYRALVWYASSDCWHCHLKLPEASTHLHDELCQQHHCYAVFAEAWDFKL